jgi:hypothetical protein
MLALRNEGLDDWYYSSRIIGVIKWRMMGLMGSICSMNADF